jgi:RNA polymerase sigma-70 factor (ECF subfamily)
VRTWLYRIAVNACLMRLPEGEESPDPHGLLGHRCDRGLADSSDNLEGIGRNSELSQQIDMAVAGLPHDLRPAVALRDIQELSNAEAAGSLAITLASLKAWLHRGRVLLRERLARYVGTLAMGERLDLFCPYLAVKPLKGKR